MNGIIRELNRKDRLQQVVNLGQPQLIGSVMVTVAEAIKRLKIIRVAEAIKRLEELRTELRAERISYGELAELQFLSEHIDEGDVELLQWAGVLEN